MCPINLSDKTKFVLTDKGYAFIDSNIEIKKNIENYPTYDDLLKRHTDYFKVKEKINSLCQL